MKLNILLKECQLSQSTEQGITTYFSPNHQNPFVTTLTVPITIKPKLSLISSYIYLPKGYGNNIRLIIIGFLEVGFDRAHFRIIDKIKQFLYDDKTILANTNKNQAPEKIKDNYRDEHLKKVLMQFFNIVASHAYPTAHVYYFILSYPSVLTILELLFKKILESQGIKMMQNTKQELSTPIVLEILCKFFDCLFQRAQQNVYWIARKVVFLQDKTSIYKNKFDQQGADKMLADFDFDDKQLSPSPSNQFKLDKPQSRVDNIKTHYHRLSDHNPNSVWVRSQSGSRLTMEHDFITRTQPNEDRRNNNMFMKKDSITSRGLKNI